MEEVRIRRITAADDAAVAALIREVMPEFGASGEGFAIRDPEVDAMSAAYAGARSGYWVLEAGGRVVGAGGCAQLVGAPPDTCELRKMYLRPEIRGRGLGRELLGVVLAAAKGYGYRRCYLETMGTMIAARRLYEANGFSRLGAPEGATGHFGCDAWYVRELQVGSKYPA